MENKQSGKSAAVTYFHCDLAKTIAKMRKYITNIMYFNYVILKRAQSNQAGFKTAGTLSRQVAYGFVAGVH